MKKTFFIIFLAMLVALAFSRASPMLDTVSNITVAENSIYLFNITSSLPDNGSTTFSYNLSLPWLSLQKINDTLATITLTPNFTNSGNYAVLFNASDVNSTSSQSMIISVTNTNRIPSLSVTSAISVISGYSAAINLSQYSSDADGDSLSYAVVYEDLSKADCSIVNGNILNITANSSYSQGASSCNVSVTDANGGSANATISIIVIAQNPSLTISQNPNPIVLATYSNGGSTSFTIGLTNNGNVPLSKVNVTFTNFIGTSKNITFTNSVSNKDVAVSTTLNSESLIVSVPDASYPEGTYTATATATYAGRTTSQTVTLTLRSATYSVSVPSELNIGSTSQIRNTTAPVVYFDITNNGDYNIMSTNVTGNFDSRYNSTFSYDNVNFAQSVLSNVALAPGATRRVYVKLFVPQSQSSQKIDIGDIRVITPERNTTISTVYLQAETKLIISDLNVKVNTNTKDANNGETLSNIRLGSKLEFQVELENTFNEDIEIEDAEVEVVIYDIDDGDDVDETSSSVSIKDGSTKRVYLNFELPDTLDEGTYSVDITASGKDENGGYHDTAWKIYLDVEKLSHDVKIVKAELDTTILSCTRQTSLNMKIVNAGQDDEERVKLQVTSPQLGINFVQQNIELIAGTDSDAEYSKSLLIDVPESTNQGTYIITVNSYYNDGVLDDRKEVTLTIEDCKQDSTSSTERPDETMQEEVVIEDLPTTSQTTQGQTGSSSSGAVAQGSAGTIVSTEGSSIFDSPVYVALLVFANVAIVGGIAFLLMKIL